MASGSTAMLRRVAEHSCEPGHFQCAWLVDDPLQSLHPFAGALVSPHVFTLETLEWDKLHD
jgi:hypothetical protein